MGTPPAAMDFDGASIIPYVLMVSDTTPMDPPLGEQADVSSDETPMLPDPKNNIANSTEENRNETLSDQDGGIENNQEEALEDESEIEEVELGDEETFAVEKVLAHRIRTKANVSHPF